MARLSELVNEPVEEQSDDSLVEALLEVVALVENDILSNEATDELNELLVDLLDDEISVLEEELDSDDDEHLDEKRMTSAQKKKSRMAYKKRKKSSGFKKGKKLQAKCNRMITLKVGKLNKGKGPEGRITVDDFKDKNMKDCNTKGKFAKKDPIRSREAKKRANR